MTSFYYVVEVVVPPGGLGRRLDNMHEFHRQRGLKDQRGPRRRDDEHDYLRWCFADLATAEAFALNSAARYCNKKAAPISEGGDLVRCRALVRLLGLTAAVQLGNFSCRWAALRRRPSQEQRSGV